MRSFIKLQFWTNLMNIYQFNYSMKIKTAIRVYPNGRLHLLVSFNEYAENYDDEESLEDRKEFLKYFPEELEHLYTKIN